MFTELDLVRVNKLMQSDRPYSGTASVMHPPLIGDCGTIVHITPGMPGNPSWCIVECLDQNGLTIWLADFSTEELERVKAV